MNRINETESPHAELRDDVIFFGGIVAFAFTAFAFCYFLWALFDWNFPATACMVRQSLGLICN